jgi:cyclopropane-fatty-acyl-phospholipid synthase
MSRFNRLCDLLEKRIEKSSDLKFFSPFMLKGPDGNQRLFGNGTPVFSLRLNNEQAVSSLSTMDQESIARSYLFGDIDVEGEIIQVLSLRNLFRTTS